MRSIITLAAVLLSASVASAQVRPAPYPLPAEFAPHDILYGLRDGVGQAVHPALMEQVGAVEHRVVWPGLVYKMVLSEDRDLREAIDTLRADPRVRYAEPNGIVHAVDTIPDDPSYPVQYGLPIISAPAAWDLHTEASDVLLAVIDTGIEYDHPDLAANIWTNPGEIPGNSVDDDGNGYVDDVHGYDFYNSDSDPRDDHFHGTHCAGIIGAVTDNGLGVAGCAWSAKMVAVKFLNSSGSGTWEGAVDSIEYAVAIGAQLSSNSWGGTGGSSALDLAIAAAGDAGHLFVAAAGNNGFDLDTNDFYPAKYEHDCIVSVAATDDADARASFSNWGDKSVDLAAPGVSVYSTSLGAGYTYASGTSMACPHVAGACAMVFSYSGSTDWSQVKQWVLDGVDLVPSMTDACITDGRLNLRRALDQTLRPSLPTNGLLLSVQNAAVLGGFSVDHSDVVHLDPVSGAYTMIVDFSDVIGSNPNLTGLAVLADGSLLCCFGVDGLNLDGAGTVDNEDVVRFLPQTYGDVTTGLFRTYFDGSDVGLDLGSEALSALSLDADGDLLLSTRGAFDVGTVSGKNEDVLEFVFECRGRGTSGSFALLFDGNSPQVRLGKNGEQINALHYHAATGEFSLSTGGDFRVPVNLFGQNDDLLLFTPTALGSPTEGSFTLVLDGAAYGLDIENVSALVVLD